MKLMICPPLILSKPSAGVRRVLDVYSRFRRHQVVLCVDSGSLQDSEPAVLAKLSSFREVVKSHSEPGLLLPWSVLRLASLARQADAVVCYDEFPPSVIYSYLVAKLSRKPLIIFYHIIIPATARRFNGSTFSPLSALYRKAILYSSAAICLDNGKEYGIFRSFFPDKPLHLAFNGAECPDTLSVDANGHSFEGLYMGVLQPRKGIMYFPDIWKEVSSRVPGAKLRIAGKSVNHNAETLRRKLVASGLGENVEMPGFVSEEEKRTMLNNAKVFIFPSLDEGLSLALLEALSSGVPAVLWDLPVFERFNEGVLKAHYPDTKDFADKVVSLIKDEAMRRETGKRGRTWVMEHMSWDNAAAREEDIFDRIASDMHLPDSPREEGAPSARGAVQ